MKMTNQQDNLPVFPQLDGIFVLNKPGGPSSAQCLKIFKRLGQKKIGHGGTLDPFAQGVLLVLLGQATKLSSWLLEGGVKTYRGVLCLGIETDSWDITGNIISKKQYADISENRIEQCIKDWKKLEEQEVPAFSAARYMGRPLYELARKGIDTPLKIKKIKVSDAVMLGMNPPYVTFRTTCSSGSYIRSLAHSLGTRLGCGACLCELVREYSHPFDLASAISTDDLRANPELLRTGLHSIEEALPSWQVIDITFQESSRLKNGQSILADGSAALKKKAILRHDGIPVALAHIELRNCLNYWVITRGLWN